MNLNSYMPVKVVSGKDCVERNSAVFASFGKRCLVVTGGNSAKKCGALADVENALKENNISYSVFDGITQNPYTADCHKAGETARKIHADFIIGIGGGSPLDAAKSVAIFAANPELEPVDIYDMNHKNKPLPLVLVGTTSGTGSEVTGVSVLTNSDNGMKKSISGPDCYAQVSFCDYKYTCSVPYSVTVSTALDAFAHATESYFTSMANNLSDVYAEKAFKLLAEPLSFLYNKKTLPDENMREVLYEASIFAGLCLNITGTCFPHTMGYILTEDFSIPHGRACAAFTPDLLILADKFMHEKCEKMCSLMNIKLTELIDMINTLADINISISNEQMEIYSHRWTDPQKNFSRTPGEFTSKTAVEILKRYN